MTSRGGRTAGLRGDGPRSGRGGTPPRAAGEVRIDPGRVPIRVAEVDLAPGAGVGAGMGVAPGGGGPVVRLAAGAAGPVPPGEVLALVRWAGRPLGMLQTVLDEGGDPSAALAEAARAAYADQLPPEPRSVAQVVDERSAASLPFVSVVIATRERTGTLARCLDAVGRLEYPRREVVVVDNAPETDATERLVKERYGALVRYVREPRRGLANAHNRGVAEALGELIAFTDDDVVVDPGWLDALVEPFRQAEAVGCVTGLILPARLETPAQAALEAHGGFAKGFRRREYSLAQPPPEDPLFPFTAGKFGSGANMAFRAEAVRAIRGFDPATGTGTPARGGDDLIGFFQVVAAGHTLVYQPEAIVWHHHRERQEDLDTQAYGYGAGLGAYLAAAVAREPRMLPALLRRLPGGLRYALTRTAAAEAAADPHAWPARLSRLERRGMLYGPIGYLRSRRRVRGLPLPWEAPHHGH